MLVEGNEENNSLTAITDSVYECETCTDKFQRARDFIMHMENNHQNAAVQFLQWNFWLYCFGGNDYNWCYDCYMLSFLFVKFKVFYRNVRVIMRLSS